MKGLIKIKVLDVAKNDGHENDGLIGRARNLRRTWNYKTWK